MSRPPPTSLRRPGVPTSWVATKAAPVTATTEVCGRPPPRPSGRSGTAPSRGFNSCSQSVLCPASVVSTKIPVPYCSPGQTFPHFASDFVNPQNNFLFPCPSSTLFLPSNAACDGSAFSSRRLENYPGRASLHFPLPDCPVASARPPEGFPSSRR